VLINKPKGNPSTPLGGFPQEASRGPSAAGRDRSLENNVARLLLWKTPSFMPEANPCQNHHSPPFLPVSSQPCRFCLFWSLRSGAHLDSNTTNMLRKDSAAPGPRAPSVRAGGGSGVSHRLRASNPILYHRPRSTTIPLWTVRAVLSRKVVLRSSPQ
jgi:hypothetical protein